jgi:hypothetical protein
MPNKTKAIVKKQATGLANWQIQALQAKTPKENIFKRQGRGNRWVDYVKIGYTIQQLNKIFSPLGWDFEIVEDKETDKDVILKGKLTIKDHKGHTVTKTQYGQSDKQKTGVPLGDTYKAAASDCLKKCASLLGLSLDVYAPVLENNGQATVPTEPVTDQSPQVPGKYLLQLKALLTKAGAKNQVEALAMIEKKTGLKIKDFNISEKHASIILAAILNEQTSQKK